MGQIRKVASPKHEATLKSPYVTEFVKTAIEIPVSKLPQHLSTFPRPWAFPRGDLYHWIGVLNRFDTVLDQVCSAYGLNEGPQVEPFSRKYVSTQDATSTAGDDLEVLEAIVSFTCLLYDNCANRSLYTADNHLDALLNTTSLSLLNLVLRMGYFLGQRYASERLRSVGHPQILPALDSTILSSIWQVDLSKLDKLVLPFVKSLKPSAGQSANVKVTDKGTSVTPLLAPELTALAEDIEDPEQRWQQYGSAWLNYHHAPADLSTSAPPSPSPGQQKQPPTKGWRLIEVQQAQLASQGVHAVLKEHLPLLPKEAHYEFLCRVRAASALCESPESRSAIINTRLLAVANVASVYSQAQFDPKIFSHEAAGARRSSFLKQVCDLLHPPTKNNGESSRVLQTSTMIALESFMNHRGKALEAANALGYNVNHGVMTYLIRKAVSDLEVSGDQSLTEEESNWYAAFFNLLQNLPKTMNRGNDTISATGVLDAFTKALRLRTVKAEQVRYRFLNYMDYFVYATAHAIDALAQTGGLDVLPDLIEHEVNAALESVRNGNGLPDSWKSPITFSKINFVKSQSLRTLFKTVNKMITYADGQFDRLLRNFIESTQVLGGLRTVLEHPTVFGSNVWCGAVEIFTAFIHNEPTSYAVIAEGGLPRAFLQSITEEHDPQSGRNGLLPNAETLSLVPMAFGAICLNEAGMKTFTESQALEKFFGMIYSLAVSGHPSAVYTDSANLGSAFDELSRHHPSLRPQIMQHFVKLVKSVKEEITTRHDLGSLSLSDGQGNRVPEIPHDVPMSGTGTSTSTTEKTVNESIHFVFSILQYLFHNTSLTTPFAESGGVQALVDLLATSVLHIDHLMHFSHGPVTKTMQTFITHKPSITIPLILDRLRTTISTLEDEFTEAQEAGFLFGPYIAHETINTDKRESGQPVGSRVLFNLLTIKNLVHVLTKSFTESSHRNTNHPLTVVNMADYYVEIIASFGELQIRCIREFMAIQDTVSAQDAELKSSGAVLDAAQDSATAATAVEQPESVKKAREVARQNFKLISTILSRAPTDIAWLLGAVGKSLVLHRRLVQDAYHRQCVFKIANAIAESIVSVLDHGLPEGMSAKLVDYYHRSSITCATIATVEKTRDAGVQPLTLILWKLKQAGGYEVLTRIGQTLLEHSKLSGYGDTPEAKARGPTLAIEALRNLTIVLGRSVSSKEISEAHQTVALNSASREGRTSPDYFSAGQFLVEIRTLVARFMLPIWQSDSITEANADFVKAVCTTMQWIMNSEAEAGAFNREDDPPTSVPQKHRTLNEASADVSEPLIRTYGRDLALEALYRCNNNKTYATEYCTFHRSDPAMPTFPIPTRDLPSHWPGVDTNEDADAASPEETEKITAEDLDELRSKFRETMIERCLYVLNKYDKLSFNIADLIMAGVSKSSDPIGMRSEIGETLVQSLISYQAEEGAAQDNERIASLAHVIGVLLQDRSWYDSTESSLNENFETLCLFVPSTSSPEKLSWLASVLLILEKILAEELSPDQTRWVPPSQDAIEQSKWDISSLREMRALKLQLNDRMSLFNALVELMPRVGKDTLLGTAVIRVLVCLTRHREIADRLTQRKELQRFFVMIKQLSTVWDKKLQGTVAVVLRQVIEDDSIIRQVMKTEILTFFERHTPRPPIDTTVYARGMYQAILRDPAIFLQVTDELVQLSKFDRSQTPQVLTLKSQPEETNQPDSQALTSNSGNTTEIDVATASKPAEASTSTSAAASKPETKLPVVERNDGVINFLLSELLAYRDVHDVHEKTAEAAEDVVMTGATDAAAASTAATDNTSTTQTSNAAAATTAQEKKASFKAEDHPIFVYRCFLLQTLAEMLQSYNTCKLNFINYSRKGEPQANTPSKPRSGVLYYLLNTLIPVAPLPQTATGSTAAPDEKAKMNIIISYWASAVIVALCARTSERRQSRQQDDDDYVLEHVRRFVLEQSLKAFKETEDASTEAHARQQCLADLFGRLLIGKPGARPSFTNTRDPADDETVPSQRQVARIMFEKNYIAALTSSLSDLDTSVPGAGRTVKHILRPLRMLTHTAIDLSMSGEASSEPGQSTDEDVEMSSATSLSDRSDGREETPDLFRNSTLGMFEPGRADASSSESSHDEDDDDALYDDHGEPYADDMEFDEDMGPGHDDDAMSDEEDEDEDMAGMEDVDGDVPMDMEIELGQEDHDPDDDSLESDEDSEEDDDSEAVSDDDVVEVMEEESSADEDNNDGSSWQDEDQDEHEPVLVIGGGAGPGAVHVDVDDDDEAFDGDADELDDPHDPIDLDDPAADEDAYNELGGLEEESDEDEPSEGEEEYMFEQDADDENMSFGGLGEDDDLHSFPWVWPPPGRRHNQHRHVHHLAFGGGGPADRDRYLMPGFRSHRNTSQGRGYEEDANPLLSRQRPQTTAQQDQARIRTPGGMTVSGASPNNILARLERELAEGSTAMGLESALLNLVQGTQNALQFTMRQVPGLESDEMRYVLESHGPHRHHHLHHHHHHHSVHGPPFSANSPQDEMAAAVSYEPVSTDGRWQEAVRILFGTAYAEKSARIINALLKLLVPSAMERDLEQKRKTEEAERKRKEVEAKEKAEREEAESKKRAEEEEQRKKEEEERAAREAAEAAEAASDGDGDAEMDVSDDEPPPASDAVAVPDTSSQTQEEPRQQVTTQIRGQTIDITDLGIDAEYLEALPEEYREDVISQQYHARRTSAATSNAPAAAATGSSASAAPSAISPEFLDALPPELRAEILQQEAAERRREERAEERRRQQAQGNAPAPAQPEEMDPASFFASLDPVTRQQVLAESPDDVLDILPPDVAAEARALGGSRRISRQPNPFSSGFGAAPGEPPSYLFAGGGRGSGGDRPNGQRDGNQGNEARPQRRPIVQMIDKSGIATLLRLMFVPVVGGSKSSLNTILMNACGNRQTRGEVINGLLAILQDGCADDTSIERCFSQLTTRAKATSKTPQSTTKRQTSSSVADDASPQMVVGQCLSALLYLADSIPTVAPFFLTEHEISGAFKPKAAKKGKGKEVARNAKYPFLALLSLLERDAVLQNSVNMDRLSGLLAMVTRPLGDILRKKEAAETAEASAATEAAGTAEAAAATGTAATTTAEASTTEQPATADAQASTTQEAPTTQQEAATTQAEKEPEKKKRAFTPPEVAPDTLRPIVNILLARECSGQTFRNTITTGTNLSAIAGAKDKFKEELLRNARELSTAIKTSLKDFIAQLATVDTDLQAQGLAMADFSPNGSDQTKLSRVITALDYFYPLAKHSNKSITDERNANNEDLLRLLEDPSFTELWQLLSKALDATKRSENEYFFNVATILLPLIEALLVVCKRLPLREKKESGPGLEMRNIFFTFTNRHKKILNDLVRQNPKLMNANFSVLVNNSGVLEFDNKRSYFNRQLHNRHNDMQQRDYPSSHPTLQLNVRRDQVFFDSYKGLHYKQPNEIKYGKLNIRFHNEEGVDAGGVTREWFQVLARQMFNPDYVLFNPVSSDRTTFHPNSMSYINEEHLHFFKFIGRIIGKALYENRVLDCHFSRAVYKKILGQPVTMKDMETIDLDYSKNMAWMLNNNITDVLTETFSISQDKFGVEEVIDLVPDGRNVPVTEENKQQFVQKVIAWRLTGSVQEQLDSFLEGFYDIVSPTLISIFDEGELELLISGMPDIDIDDWRANTDYHNYTTSSPQIQWFWRAVRSFDKEERAKLLQFVTGAGKVPLNGFKELEGMNGFTRFAIHKDFSSKDRLPSSHTCFNQLDLPEYDDYDSLRKALYTAMTTGNEYFGYA